MLGSLIIILECRHSASGKLDSGRPEAVDGRLAGLPGLLVRESWLAAGWWPAGWH